MSAGLASQRPLLVVTDLMGTTLRDDGAVLPDYRAAFAECAIPFSQAREWDPQITPLTQSS